MNAENDRELFSSIIVGLFCNERMQMPEERGGVEDLL